jgi:hypothetical protein
MSITIYKSTSASKAGAIKITTGSLLSGFLEFNSDQNYKYFTSYSYLSGSLSAISITPFISSYSVGLSSSISSNLTSVNLNQTTFVLVNKSTGQVSISAQNPGTYAFNIFASTETIGRSLTSIILSATVPVTVLSSSTIVHQGPSYLVDIVDNQNIVSISREILTTINTVSSAPLWSLPRTIYVSVSGGPAQMFNLAFAKDTFTDFDEIAARYVSSFSTYSLILAREYNDTNHSWKFVQFN